MKALLWYLHYPRMPVVSFTQSPFAFSQYVTPRAPLAAIQQPGRVRAREVERS